MKESPYFESIGAVADYFNRSTRTIRRWMRQQRIPHYRLDGGQVLFDRREIAAWIAAGRREAVAPPQKARVCTYKTAEPPPRGQMRPAERSFPNIPPRF